MAEVTEATKTTETTKVSSRGTGFPVLSLPEAAKIIRDAGSYGKQHTAAALAAYAGHQTANSGPWKRKAAALREWGLIVSQGSEAFALTERAVEIAHPETPEKAQVALLEAFRDSNLFMKIYDDLAKNSELNIAQLGNKAVTGHGISVTSKEQFTKSFVESAAAVGLAERIGTDKVKILPMPNQVVDDTSDEEMPKDAHESKKSGEKAKVKRSAGVPVIEQSWLIRGGEVAFSIISDKSLAATSYTEIAKVVTAVEGLVKLLGVEENDQSDDGPAN